jgi:hypothetical protein
MLGLITDNIGGIKMFEISKIYIRALTGITGITLIGLYTVHMKIAEPNVLLTCIAGICACVALDKMTDPAR